MELDKINRELTEHKPEKFVLYSFRQRGRELILAFSCDGGPKEDEVFLLTFRETPLFHVPSVLHEVVGLELVESSRAQDFIPEVSFDSDEFGERGFKIVKLVLENGKSTSYYVAAESASGEWVSRNKLDVW